MKLEQTISAPFLKGKDVQIPGESTKQSFEVLLSEKEATSPLIVEIT